MRNRIRFVRTIATVVMILASLAITTISVQGGTSSEVEVVMSFDDALGQLPEGIAVDKEGNIYVSFMPLGQLWKFRLDGIGSMLLEVGEGAFGVAVDAPGNVYMAHFSGVYCVSKDGNVELVPGTDDILWPNALAFDKRGNLYVTDSTLGAIWQIPRGGSAELWIQDELLYGSDTIPPFSPVGANGIAYWHGSLYVANTEKGLIVRIPILKGGEPGEPQVVAEEGLYGLDGIALDVHGNIYAVLVLQNMLVKIDPYGGDLTVILTVDDGLNMPASLAFGTGRGNRQSVYFTNFCLMGPGGLGPAILKVDVDEPGLPLP